MPKSTFNFKTHFLKLALLGVFLSQFSPPSVAQPPAQALPVEVNRWLEIWRWQGEVFYRRQNQPQRQVKESDRLQLPGDGILTERQSSASLRVDSDIGTVNVSQNTDLRVERLVITPTGGRITLLWVMKGQVRWRVRPFNNSESRFELKTPAGVAGVRGTEFGVSVSPSGTTNLATLEGTVEATAQGQSVLVEPGFATKIIPGQPPTPPFVFVNEAALKSIRLFRTSLGTLEIAGQVQPSDLVQIGELSVEPDADGRFKISIPFPYSLQVKLYVKTPLGQERGYLLLAR